MARISFKSGSFDGAMTAKATRILAAAAAVAFAVAASACEPRTAPAPAEPAQRAPTDWLFNLADEEARLAQLQLQLRGLDVAMWEIGERYRGLHEALTRQNFDLALYHWDKIKQSLDNALIRRPARRANAEAVFLNELWPRVREALAGRQPETAWAAFEEARSACLSCHEAENVAYMNGLAIFDIRAPGG